MTRASGEPNSVASPKSASLATPSAMSTFSGLTSRWVQPLLWQCSRATRRCRTADATTGSGSARKPRARALDELQEIGVAPLRDEEHLTSLARLHRAEHVRAPRDGRERAKLGGGEEILPARGVVRLLQVLDGVELASIVTDALARRPNGRESALAETFEKHVLVQYHRAGRAIGDPRKARARESF